MSLHWPLHLPHSLSPQPSLSSPPPLLHHTTFTPLPARPPVASHSTASSSGNGNIWSRQHEQHQPAHRLLPRTPRLLLPLLCTRHSAPSHQAHDSPAAAALPPHHPLLPARVPPLPAPAARERAAAVCVAAAGATAGGTGRRCFGRAQGEPRCMLQSAGCREYREESRLRSFHIAHFMSHVHHTIASASSVVTASLPLACDLHLSLARLTPCYPPSAVTAASTSPSSSSPPQVARPPLLLSVHVPPWPAPALLAPLHAILLPLLHCREGLLFLASQPHATARLASALQHAPAAAHLPASSRHIHRRRQAKRVQGGKGQGVWRLAGGRLLPCRHLLALDSLGIATSPSDVAAAMTEVLRAVSGQVAKQCWWERASGGTTAAQPGVMCLKAPLLPLPFFLPLHPTSLRPYFLTSLPLSRHHPPLSDSPSSALHLRPPPSPHLHGTHGHATGNPSGAGSSSSSGSGGSSGGGIDSIGSLPGGVWPGHACASALCSAGAGTAGAAPLPRHHAQVDRGGAFEVVSLGG
ncbi:unnamed protein product [Closterium sp. NIES-54]